MILFNWKRICLVGKNDLNKIIKIFYYISHDVVIKSHRDPMYSLMKGKDFSGNSFILNPKPLFSSRYSNREIFEYIALAALRNYANYQITGEVGLSLLHCPLRKETIEKNRLLSIEKDKVMFAYERK